MPLAGVVVNRMVRTQVPELDSGQAERLAERLGQRPGDTAAGPSAGADTSGATLVPQMLALHADLARTAVRHQDAAGRFADRHPGVPIVPVPLAPLDVHDLDGLRHIADDLTRSEPV